MVLSNKKLKQKLRAEKTVSKDTNSNATNPETPTSLKHLLNLATQKPILSKREKRRLGLNSQNPELENGGKDENKGAHVEEVKSKKRKREKKEVNPELENGESKVAHVEEMEDGVGKKKKKRKKEKKDVKEGEKGGDLSEKGGELLKKVNKKKKKKKKYKKKGKKVEKEKEMKEVESGNGGVVEQIVDQNVGWRNSQGNDEDKKKIYVGGIPFYSTEDDIRSYFDHCGTITDLDCMTFPESGKFRGIAIISFKTQEAAKRALALDGSDMGGLYLKIQPYKAPPAAKPTSTIDFCPPVTAGYNRIYAGNLSWDITEDDLRNLFADCKISALRFGEDKETGEFKGYAHVDFCDETSLAKALQLDQTVVCGRPIRIRCAVPPKNGAVRTSGTEAVKAEPIKSEAVKAEPIKSEAVKAEPVKSESVKAEPVKLEAVKAEPVKFEAVKAQGQSNSTSSTGVSAGKLKRRTCYECGERGHISSDCPKKQATDEANPSAS